MMVQEDGQFHVFKVILCIYGRNYDFLIQSLANIGMKHNFIQF